jgi:hypothetical protein
MSITRDNNEGDQIQRMIVPISYGPYQKFLAKITQDPALNRPQAVSLPRMSFEITSMNYDGQRKTNSLNKLATTNTSFVFSPAPYNIEFNLYIMTKYAEDGTKILEQIIPFFKPEYTFTAFILDDLPALDLPLILNSVTVEDIYDGDFETRRSLMWTLSFTMKGWFFGPQRERKRIKFIDVRNYPQIEVGGGSNVLVQPGLTANGEPTTNVNETISFDQIDLYDDWGVITIIEDIEENNE